MTAAAEGSPPLSMTRARRNALLPGLEKPLSVTGTNDFGADDIPVGAPIRLGYDPEALAAMAD